MPIPSDYSTPLRVSAKDRALNQLQQWIIDGTLLPGEKLNDSVLAEALGVSRTPIREALQVLEMQGLVQMSPGKETRVTELDHHNITQMYVPFVTLHALAIEIAASHITEDQLTQLKELNEQFAKYIEANMLYQAIEYDEKFHETIMESSGNPYLLSCTASLQMHIRRYKYQSLKGPFGLWKTAVKEHKAIIEALEQRDATAAVELLRNNLLAPKKLFHDRLGVE
jgi:DNA-binding GntR family transcriptional regulator